MCLTTISALAQSQSTPTPTVSSTNVSGAASRNTQTGKSLPDWASPAWITARTPDAGPASESSPSLGGWPAPKWNAAAEREFSRITLGKRDFAASGFLVDMFRPSPAPAEKSAASGMFLGIPVTNMFVVEPWPSGGWKRTYWKWGEREEAWSTIAERRSAGPQSALFSLHF